MSKMMQRIDQVCSFDVRLDSAPFMGVENGQGCETNWYMPCKLAAELACALVLLIVTFPLLLLSAVLVRLTSRGPVFYSQTRLGRHGRPFTIYKIRTMRHNCEALSGPQWSKPGDNRITAVGRFLRRTHLDELPQLWNVLRGDMSLIGPRPERPEFVPQLEQTIPCYRDRLLVRPGITGLAQVQLPPDTDMASVRRKLAHDLFYVRKAGLFLDLRILLATSFGLVGVPARLTRMMLRLPGGPSVEEAYEKQVADLQPSPELQLA
jgi:lipopolysaccharide/colanic/teichoic acid biosynthesis glycosyltransferase